VNSFSWKITAPIRKVGQKVLENHNWILPDAHIPAFHFCRLYCPRPLAIFKREAGWTETGTVWTKQSLKRNKMTTISLSRRVRFSSAAKILQLANW
jgi:hypothetical protein